MKKLQFNSRLLAGTFAAVTILGTGAVQAADVTVTPPVGGDFVVNDSTSAEHLRIRSNGDAYIPGLANAPSTGTELLCMDGTTGRLIKCVPNVGAGAQGPAGIAGPAGPVGLTGATGAAGPAGLTGATGVAGPTGPIGVTGAAGPTGSIGATGVAGPAGPAGPTGGVGSIGATGATGATGGTGPQGLQGLQGNPGATGANGSIAAVTVREIVGAANGDLCTAISCCSTGERTTGGGYLAASGNPAAPDDVRVSQSGPAPIAQCSNGGWAVRVLTSFPGSTPTCSAQAMCAQ